MTDIRGAPPPKTAKLPPQSPSTPTVEQTAKKSKSIVLFSDGTGNSSAKLFKTNVWRMYEAVDLGLPKGSERVQVAYYDNGVGTSSLRPVAMLTGIFGIGLKRNVLAIYRFVCRNYRDGDHIYAFGFSRGAFTIRLVAAMIASEGIVLYESEAELNARSRDVLRAFGAKNSPNFAEWVGKSARAIRKQAVRLKRSLAGPDLRDLQVRENVKIEFLGVWDTVAAYGGPSAEVTRAVDNFIYPLTMTDQCLCEGIKVARHALALDDERDAFAPLLWDELDWHQRAETAHPGDDKKSTKERVLFRQRLRQVWFAGMHSDVGGGYPDESLSFVSLQWMMAEAQAAKLRLIPGHVDRIREMSNSLGPIHNSRSGMASYYRYQPRKIDAFLHPQSGMDRVDQTLVMRDPVLGEKQSPPQGFLLSCQVHESVAARIAFGTDDYAPITLPLIIKVVRYSQGGAGAGGNPHVSDDLCAALEKGDAGWSARHETLYNKVWGRRAAYFFTTISSLLLLATPLYADLLRLPHSVDNRWIPERLTGWTHHLLPDFVQPWVRAFEISPLLFWGLVVAILVGTVVGSLLEAAIQSRMRDLWKERLNSLPPANSPPQTAVPAQPVSPARRSWLERIRNSRTYQRSVQLFKWYLLPIYVGLALLAALLYAAAILWTQGTLSFAEPWLCVRGSHVEAQSAGDTFVPFDASKMCNPTGLTVYRGHRYAVEFVVLKPKSGAKQSDQWQYWKDGSSGASPEGLTANDLEQILGIPLRRLIDARYMQPLYEVRPPDDGLQSAIVKPISVAFVESKGNFDIYRGDFIPTVSGELFLFVNDATVAWDIDRFYTHRKWGNKGTARVYIHDLHALPILQIPAESETADH